VNVTEPAPVPVCSQNGKKTGPNRTFKHYTGFFFSLILINSLPSSHLYHLVNTYSRRSHSHHHTQATKTGSFLFFCIDKKINEFCSFLGTILLATMRAHVICPMPNNGKHHPTAPPVPRH
jgi:hypothetical protein